MGGHRSCSHPPQGGPPQTCLPARPQSLLATVSHWAFPDCPLLQGDPGRPGFSYPGPRGAPVSPSVGWGLWEGRALSWGTGRGQGGDTGSQICADTGAPNCPGCSAGSVARRPWLQMQSVGRGGGAGAAESSRPPRVPGQCLRLQGLYPVTLCLLCRERKASRARRAPRYVCGASALPAPPALRPPGTPSHPPPRAQPASRGGAGL